MEATLDSLDNLSISTSSSTSNVPKTSVSVLHELFMPKGIVPKYDLIQIEGAVHEPIFRYRVSVGELMATGSGQSKKKAKHNAARAMLEQLISIQPSNEKILVKVEIPEKIDTDFIQNNETDGINGNPVGELQEICTNRRLPPPLYEVGEELGAPHERSYVMICTVGNNLRYFTYYFLGPVSALTQL